jgi:hypothetical protein
VSMREGTKRCWNFLASTCESALSRWGGGWCFAGMEADGRKRGERTAKI